MAANQHPPPTTTQADIGKLIAVLAPLVDLYRGLSRILEQERQALEQRKPDLLESLATQIGQILEEIHASDQIRQRLTRQMGARLGLSGDRLDLQSLDQALGGNTGLLPVREQLKAEIEKADTTNRHNQAVFNGVLTATESMLRALKESAQGPVASYNRKGARHASGAAFHLISKQL